MDLTRYDDKALALLSSIQQDIAAMRYEGVDRPSRTPRGTAGTAPGTRAAP